MSTSVTYPIRLTGSSCTSTFHGVSCSEEVSVRSIVSVSAMDFRTGSAGLQPAGWSLDGFSICQGCHAGLRLGCVPPFPVLADQINQTVDRLLFRDIETDRFLAH